MIIEVVAFRPTVEHSEFITLNEEYQEAVAYQSPGLLRRTVAAGADGAWVEVRLWSDDSERVMSGDSAARARWEHSIAVESSAFYSML